MLGGTMSALFTAGSLAIVVALGGCAGHPATTSSTEAPAQPPAVTATPSTSGVPTATPTARAEVAHGDFVELPELADVRFRPGLVTVGKAEATVVDAVVRWLKENQDGHVRIEGHTDDLGNRGDNLAVGERRAVSVMKYLIGKGLEPGRISIVSYGPDRPVCAERTHAGWAKNRRAHFLVKRP